MALKYLYVPSGYKAGTAYGVLPNDSSADFDQFTRSSFATRTNKDGLIEVCETSGNNLVTNGDFATDSSDWNKTHSSITISGGKANFTDTPNGYALQQNNFLTTGKTYEVTFTVSDYVEGAINVRYPFITPSVNSNGVHTVTGVAVTSSGGSDDLRLQVTGETTLKIDDVYVREVLNNVPRIDYSDGGCPSLLLETQRTNECKYSEHIYSWGKNPSSSAVTIRRNEEVSPDGKRSADIVSVLTEYDGVETPSITSISNTTYSCSAYVKHVSGSSKIRLGISAGFHSGTGSKYVRFDLSDGSVILDELGGVGEFKSVYVGDGWYRLIIENILIPVNEGGSSKFLIYSYVDGLTEFAVWGGQVEVGSYTSSYIPNLYNGTITRVGDAAKYAGNFEFNSSEGVLEARFKAVPISIPTSRITFGATSSNRVALGYSGGINEPKPYLLIVSPSGVDEIIVSMPSSFNLFDYNTYKFKFQSGNNELKINGELVETDNTFKTHTFAFDSSLKTISLNLHGESTSRVFYGGIQHIKIYDSVTDF
jgi:hypothetical protein